MIVAFDKVSRSLVRARVQMMFLLALVPCAFAAAAKGLSSHVGPAAYGLLGFSAMSLLLGIKLEPGLRRLEAVRVRLYRHQTKKARRAMEI
ncbi:hypothetical protein ABIC83_002874 [Roseateles asaccharophilus]|uniref:hypothetical protein n=1 Tax=Roseateles asaccharophilus TaxID=582607 RepID=UPI003832DC3A